MVDNKAPENDATNKDSIVKSDTPEAPTPKKEAIPMGDAEYNKPSIKPIEEKKEAVKKPKKKFKFKSGGFSGDKKEVPKVKSSDSSPAISSIGSLSAVVTRNEYYRDGFRNLLKIAIIEGIIIALMICTFVFYMYASKPQDRYFATTADGRIMRLVPLAQPNMTSAALLSWVSQAATDVMTFGFHDYRQRLQSASQHFTRRGWESFTGALQRSRIIDGVESSQQVLTAVPRSAPIILQEGVFNGKYRWIIELPLMVTYQSGKESRTDTMTVTITVERVPTLESTNGVGIEQWIAL